MTPVEAMKQAVARLRTLGFTIVPVEPTDEQVEAMARALCVAGGIDPDEDRDGGKTWRLWERDARAAYAAAVREVVGD